MVLSPLESDRQPYFFVGIHFLQKMYFAELLSFVVGTLMVFGTNDFMSNFMSNCKKKKNNPAT